MHMECMFATVIWKLPNPS